MYEETKGYVRDMLSCLDEKVPEIEEGQNQLHKAWLDRADGLAERAKADIMDQYVHFDGVPPPPPPPPPPSSHTPVPLSLSLAHTLLPRWCVQYIRANISSSSFVGEKHHLTFCFHAH